MTASAIRAAFQHYLCMRGVKAKRYAKSKKLKEETKELIEALNDHKKIGTRASKVHLMEEVADVAWCIAAISEDNGFSVEDAMELKTARDLNRNRPKSKLAVDMKSH